ncbi:MAG: hypothetical protein CMM58_01895 [Rhodospirillaceae bacterium]|nr:hypothetical protein [Rhodospirillaceae bacterium]
MQKIEMFPHARYIKISGVACAILCSLGLGIAVALGRLAFDGGTTPLTVAFFRSLLSMFLMMVVCKIIGLSLRLPAKIWLNMLLLGCLFSHMAYGNVGSTKYIPISLAALLFFIYPPIVTLINHLIDKTWPTFTKLLSIAVVFLGLGIMLGVDLGRLDPIGIIIGLTAGLACAVNIVWISRKVSNLHPFVIVFYQSAISSLIIGMIVWQLNEFRLPFISAGWLGLILIVVLQSCSIPLFYFAIQRIGAESTALINNSQPVASIMAAILIFGEMLTQERLLGAFMVVGGIIAIQWDDIRNMRKKAL